MRYFYMLPVEAVQIYGLAGKYGAICVELADSPGLPFARYPVRIALRAVFLFSGKIIKKIVV